jgi:hypothetical protein
VVVPLTRIRTTAGPALAAASMTAEDSSTVTGTLLPTVVTGVPFEPMTV